MSDYEYTSKTGHRNEFYVELVNGEDAYCYVNPENGYLVNDIGDARGVNLYMARSMRRHANEELGIERLGMGKLRIVRKPEPEIEEVE